MKLPSHLRKLLISGLFLASGATPSHAQSLADFEELKASMKAMQKTIDAQNSRIVALEKEKAAPAPASAPIKPKPAVIPPIVSQPNPITNRDSMSDQQVGAPRPDNRTLDPRYTGFFPIPDSPVIMKINAKPRVDFTSDNRNTGNPDRFVTAQLPIRGTREYGGGNQFNVNSRASSFSLDARAPELAGAPRFYYETDFFGGGTGAAMTPRVKQLYGQYHNITAGFTQSVFEDPDAWPDTVDSEGPNSVIFARQPGIRYLLALHDDWHMNFGLQQPATDLDAGEYAEAKAVNHAPDGGFNIRWEDTSAGHVQFGTIYRALGANDSEAGNQTVFGWGGNLSGSLNIGDKNSMQFQATYGHGIFHFINDNFSNNDITYDDAGDLTAVPFLGLMVGYTHHWSERFRSTATFGYNGLDNELGQGGDAYHETYYGSFNLMYQIRERLTAGFEGLYGRKEVQDGGSGDAVRLQFSLQYSLF